MPSLSNSPCIRGAPHSGLATLIWRVSWRISAGVVGRPPRGRDFHRQYARKPARCQRITVSGLTISERPTPQEPDDRAPANTRRSTLLKETRVGDLRRSTLSWCRRTWISGFQCSPRLEQPDQGTPEQTCRDRSSEANINRFAGPSQPFFGFR
jgi:hypothetical protein